MLERWVKSCTCNLAYQTTPMKRKCSALTLGAYNHWLIDHLYNTATETIYTYGAITDLFYFTIKLHEHQIKQ